MRWFQLILMAAMWMCLSGKASAQQLQVVDADGEPVAFVCVTTENGVLVGTTDIDGWLDDAKGNTTLCLSHVAYEPKTVRLADVRDGKILLNKIGLEIPEVVVKPKELLYVQTYFRLISFDEDGPIYYRAGVVDNAFDLQKRKMSSKDRTLARGRNGFIRFILSTFIGGYIDRWAHLDTLSTYDYIMHFSKTGDLTLTARPGDRQIVSDSICDLGYIDKDLREGLRTTSFKKWVFKQHRKEAQEREKKKNTKKKEKKNDDDDTSEESFYEVYRIDSDGRSGISDFVMKQLHFAGSTKKNGDIVILLQCYATDYEYVNKDEYKQLRKENKVDMDIKELMQFEKNHRIPPLEPNIQKQINLLFKKELGGF